MKDMIVKRLREPSTYAGIAAFVGALGFQFAPEVAQSTLAVGTAVAALLAIWLPEKPKG